MKELQDEAKKLNINSFGKKKEELEREIETAKAANLKSDESSVRRTNNDLTLAEQRAEEIRRGWAESSYDPTESDYKLTINDKEEGWNYRWVLDKEGRVANMKRIGWQIHESANFISAGDNSNNQKLIPMKIPTVIYNELAAKKQAAIDRKEDEIVSGNTGSGGLKAGDFAPGSKIQIGNKKATFGN